MKKVKTVTEETVQDQPEEVKDDDRKVDKFFHFFKNEENFVISLYKVKERGKAELVEKYENEVPDMMKVREIWGGGTYKLYAHDFDNALLDTTVVHVAAPPEGTVSGGSDEEMVLNKMLRYKQLFGSEGNNNEIMLKIIEMQNSFSQSVSSLIAKMNEKNMETQLAMERRFSELLEKQQSNKGGFTELIQAAEFITMIKGDGGETSLLDKIIGNPIFQNIASGFIGNIQNQETKQIAPPTSTTIQPESAIPQAFIDKITRENREKGIDNLMKGYKIPRDRAETIVESILKSKGL